MRSLILAINPGSTSTKIALYQADGGRLDEAFNENIRHSEKELEGFSGIIDQIPMRKALVLDALERHGHNPANLSLVMGRGGLLPPVHTGGYKVNKAMLDMILNEELSPHISNIGAVLAYEIAGIGGGDAYIYDAVSASDLTEIAHVTGFGELRRESFYHVLNSRAVSIKYAADTGRRYEDLNLIVVHMGGGVTAGAHKKGKIIDTLADDNGPFGPERSGGAPLLSVVELCYSGRYTKKEMIKKIRGNGGLKGLVGTSDGRTIEEMINSGDEKAALAYEAQAYQIAKAVGLLSAVLEGKVDAVILTGGLAFSTFLTDRIKRMIGFIAPVEVFPGEFEMEALALGGLRILQGLEAAREL